MDYLKYEHRANNKYSLRGRTIKSVLKAAVVWHNARANNRYPPETTWAPIPVKNAHYVIKKVQWCFKQLTVAIDLYNEGTIMRHCVGGYVEYCINGTSAIFSLASRPIDSEETYAKAVTIEVRKHDETYYVAQCRTRCNRTPNSEEMNVINQWAASNNMSRVLHSWMF
jgi:hypothetical protein